MCVCVYFQTNITNNVNICKISQLVHNYCRGSSLSRILRIMLKPNAALCCSSMLPNICSYLTPSNKDICSWFRCFFRYGHIKRCSCESMLLKHENGQNRLSWYCRWKLSLMPLTDRHLRLNKRLLSLFENNLWQRYSWGPSKSLKYISLTLSCPFWITCSSLNAIFLILPIIILLKPSSLKAAIFSSSKSIWSWIKYASISVIHSPGHGFFFWYI